MSTLPDKSVCIGDLAQIPLGEGREFEIGNLHIAAFRLRDGSVYAIQAQCPHQGAPLADGIVGGCEVICPFHGRKFNLATGAQTSPTGSECRIATYAVRIDKDNKIWIN